MRKRILLPVLCAFVACASKVGGGSTSPGDTSGAVDLSDAGVGTTGDAGTGTVGGALDSGTLVQSYDRVVFGAHGCSVTVHADNTYLSDGGLSTEHEFFTKDELQLYLLAPDAGWVQVDWPSTPNGDSSQCRSELLGSPYALFLSRADLLDMVSYIRGAVVLEGTLSRDIVANLSHPLFARPHVFGDNPGLASGTGTVTFTGGSANFTPTFTYDWLFLYSPEAGAVVPASQVRDDAGTAGYVNPISFDFSAWVLGPIDATKGDTTYVVDRSWVSGVLAITRAGRVPGFTVDGGTQAIDVELQPLTLDHSIDLTIDRPAYESLLASVWPGPVGQEGGNGIVDAFPPEAIMTNVELAESNFMSGSSVHLVYTPLVPGLPLEARVEFARDFDLAPGVQGEAELMAELPLDAVPNPSNH